MVVGNRCIAVLLALALPLAAGARDLSASYFAPENSLIYKAVFPDGTAREFERVISASDFALRSTGGWSGKVTGDANVVIEGPGNDGAIETWTYERGRLVGYAKGGERWSCAYPQPRPAPPSPYEPLAIVEYENAAEGAEEYEKREMAGKWSGTGRLDFPYANPNLSGCLYCELALLALMLLLVRGRRCKVAGSLLFALFAALMLMTGSRGAMLGLLLGLGVFGLSRFRELVGSKAFWAAAVVGVAVVAGYVLLFRTGDMTRGFSGDGGLDWSNALRVDMWKAAPRMMADAPGGWGLDGSGRAYMSWYMPMAYVCFPGSLMNNHLTLMVESGWWVRWLYLFAVCAVLVGGVALLRRRRNPLTLAVAAAYLAMAWFNPVYGHWGLWVIPLVSLFALRGLIAGSWRAKSTVFSALVSGVVAFVACAGIFALGRLSSRGADEVPVTVRGGGLLVNGDAPRVWVVDDGRGTLGGVLASRDVREYYAEEKTAPAMGLVRDIEDLPDEPIDRLVLAGKAGNDWLLRLSENAKARERLPKSVVFLSPPFNPSEVPPAVVASCRPVLVVGEFAAKFREEYGGKLPGWVQVVPGLEKYLMGWPEIAVGVR